MKNKNYSKITALIIKIARIITIISFIIILLYIGVRIFIYDQFSTPTSSMEPTLIPGDKILVNKLIMGARIYKKYNFTRGENLSSCRIKGFRNVRPNDIIVFNAPFGYRRNKIEFNISYVYCKRCIGTPGDTISIINGYFYNSNYIGILGDENQQQLLSQLDDSLIKPSLLATIPYDTTCNYTIKNMGPLWIPKKGDSIVLDINNYKLYSKIIAYELNGIESFQGDTLVINNTPVTNHKFKHNYFFACGDNILNSEDSRYWGFIPEEFIIGVATKILYSKDKHNKILKGRILKNL